MNVQASWSPAAVERLERIGGPDLVRRILDFFLDSTPQRLETLRQGHQQGDVERMRLAAHSLRSSAGNVGASAVSALAAHIEETLIRGDDVSAVASALTELEASFESVRPELTAILDRIKS